jgi:hypothetical protein
MTSWIERLRHKKSPDGRNSRDQSAESGEPTLSKNVIDGRSAGDKSPESRTIVTSGTPSPTVFEVLSTSGTALPSEVIIVAYQRFFFDYDLPDGSYTPQDLRQAKLLVKPGPELRYRLYWPGGLPQPITSRQEGRAESHHERKSR